MRSTTQAGVDCSDREVNIKILLDGVVAAGELTTKQRNELLVSMTDEVADLVLANNKAQTLALLMARKQSLGMANVHARYIDDAGDRGLARSPARVPAVGPPDRRASTRRHRAHRAGVRRPDRLHEEHQRGRDGAQRSPRRPAPASRCDRLLPDPAAREVRRGDPRRTHCAARSSPRSSSIRWSTCRGSPSTTA